MALIKCPDGHVVKCTSVHKPGFVFYSCPICGWEHVSRLLDGEAVNWDDDGNPRWDAESL